MTNDEFETMLLGLLKKQLVPFFLGAYQQGQLDMRRRAHDACKVETSRRAIAALKIEDSPLRETEAPHGRCRIGDYCKLERFST